MKNTESIFCSTIYLLPLLGALFFPGSKSPNMAMAIEDEDSMPLLPFGSASAIGSFIQLPHCGIPRPTNDSPHDFVNSHNVARGQVNVAPLQWDEKVANYAQQYANKRINDCKLVHSNGAYGENLAWGTPDLTNTNAVNLWIDQKQFYNYTTNSCASGKVCDQYTQVVWKDSIRIGCAKVKCKTGGAFIICNYDPRGNVIGRRPY